MFRRVSTGLLSVLMAVSGVAQIAPIVTESEFLEALDASHPSVVEATEASALARARVVASSTLENPALGFVRENPDGPVEQTDWTLSWQLPGFDRGPGIRASERSLASVEARLEYDLQALRLAMRKIYAEWAVAAARHELLADHHARLADLTSREAARAERGESSGLEARRLALAEAALEAQLVLAEAASDDAAGTARVWSPELDPGARPKLPVLPDEPDPGKQHPLILAAASRVEEVLLQQEAAGRFVPSPELMLGWQSHEAGPDSLDGPTFGLVWSIPLLGRNQAKKALTEARLAAARGQLETTRRQMSTARPVAAKSFRRLAAALSKAEEAVAANESMLGAAEAAFRHGEASLTDLLDILRSVTDSEMAVLDLREAVLSAHRELERLSSPSDHFTTILNQAPKEAMP